MKTNPAFVWRLFILFTLLALCVGVSPASPAQAASGDHLWARSIGGGGADVGHSVAADASGNLYITGIFGGTVDFDPGPELFDLVSVADYYDMYVAKFDKDGNFVWARNMGGAEFDVAYSIAVDASGNVYTTGIFRGIADFDPGVGIASLISAGGQDIFVSKLDSNGNYVWAKSIGGLNSETPRAIAVDSNGNVYSTGAFLGTADFDPGAGLANLTSAGDTDIYISKLDSNGSYVWAKRIGGAGAVYGDYSNDLAVDSSGNVYTTGSFDGTVDFNPGAGTANLISAGDDDIFISKLDTNGNFVWAKAMSGGSVEEGNAIALDPGGNIYLTGLFFGTVDFDPGAGTANLTSAGGSDVFIARLDNNGGFLWAKSVGATDATDYLDSGRDIAVDSSGYVYSTGHFAGSTDFDPGPGTTNLTSTGGVDIFISKLDANGDFVWARNTGGTAPIGGMAQDHGLGIAIGERGNLLVTGKFYDTADFDPGPGTNLLTSAGDADIFLIKLENPVPVFTDVPSGYWAGAFVERLYAAGITGGCATSPLRYCPDNTVTRAQMAIFLLKGIHTSIYIPPDVTGSTGFVDVPANYWAAAFIKQLATEGITSGCGGGYYCPENPVTRAQMAVFLLKAKYGAGYIPPAVGSGTGFGDVPVDYWAAALIKQLVTEGITAGCGNGNYCPEAPVTRAQMAVFLVKTFGLP